jgi:hypothetical protein
MREEGAAFKPLIRWDESMRFDAPGRGRWTTSLRHDWPGRHRDMRGNSWKEREQNAFLRKLVEMYFHLHS